VGMKGAGTGTVLGIPIVLKCNAFVATALCL